jgi:aryl carrier-like protein
VELALARIWSEVLRVEAVGAEDDFFALGGHSLLALRVVSKARREGLELEVHQLFQHPTLAALAASVAAPAPHPGAEAETESSPPTPGGEEEELPCTPHQRWYLETFDVENHTWAQSLAFDAPPDFHPELLRQSLAFLFEQHDVFRLRVFRSGSGWTQRMLPTAGEPWVEVLELAALEPPAQRQALLEIGSRHQQLLSIVRGPLLAAAMCRTGGQGLDKLLITLHHSVYDAYSLAVFFEDLIGTYQQLAAGQQLRPLGVRTRYRDYLLAVATHAKSRAMEQARAFWLDEARLRPVPPLPKDLPGGRHTDLNSRHHPLVLPPELMGRIASYLRTHEDVSLNDLLLHALSRAYARWSGNNLLRLDFEHNGRTGMLPGWDLSRLVGPTTVKVPLLLELSASEPPAQALARLKRTVRQTLAHALGYGLLRYGPDAAVRERLAASGSPQVFFNNRGLTLKGSTAAPQGPGKVEALVIPRADGGENVVSYDLMVECDDTEQGPMLTLVYSSKQYHDETLHALASDMLTHLLALAGEP